MKDCDLDPLDLKILEIIQEDATLSLRQIAHLTNKSTTSVSKRLKELEESGVIRKRIALLDCSHLGYRNMVIASLRVNANTSLQKIKDQIEQMTEVRYAYVVTGEHPIFVMAKCLEQPDAVALIERLRNLEGVEEVTTQIVLDRIKEDPTVLIPSTCKE